MYLPYTQCTILCPLAPPMAQSEWLRPSPTANHVCTTCTFLYPLAQSVCLILPAFYWLSISYIVLSNRICSCTPLSLMESLIPNVIGKILSMPALPCVPVAQLDCNYISPSNQPADILCNVIEKAANYYFLVVVKNEV